MELTAAPSLRVLRVAFAALALAVGLLAGLDPKLALVASIGVIFVLLTLSDLAIGLALFAFVSFLDVLPFGGAALSFSKIAGLLLAVSWVATMTTDATRENDFFSAHPYIGYALIGFVAWCGLSVLWAENPGRAFEGTYRFALDALLFPIVYAAIRNNKHVVLILATFMAGAVLSAIYGIIAPPPPDNINDISRLSGAGLDPNELASVLIAALALAAAFAAGARQTVAARVAAVVVAVFCVAGVLLSFSRGGLVALVVALFTAVIVGGRWRAGAVALLVALAGATFVYFTTFATPREVQRFVHPGGGSGRKDIWTVGWRMVAANPYVGVGVNNFAVSSVHYLLRPGVISRPVFIIDEPKEAHNIYLGMLAETGILGTALFMSILVFSLSACLRGARRFMHVGDRRMELLTRATFVALMAVLAADFFLSEIYSKQLWLLLALGPALYAVAGRREEEEAQKNEIQLAEPSPADHPWPAPAAP